MPWKAGCIIAKILGYKCGVTIVWTHPLTPRRGRGELLELPSKTG